MRLRKTMRRWSSYGGRNECTARGSVDDLEVVRRQALGGAEGGVLLVVRHRHAGGEHPRAGGRGTPQVPIHTSRHITSRGSDAEGGRDMGQWVRQRPHQTTTHDTIEAMWCYLGGRISV